MIVHEATQSLVLQHPDPWEIRDLLENSKTLDHPEYNLALQHTVEAAKVLRNMGIPAPAPIRYQYGWPGKYKPFSHQLTMAEFYTLHRRGFNLSEMGAGKTAATLWAADWLMQTGRVRKAMIISPLSTLERVWANDIFDVLMHRTCAVVHGSVERRLSLLNADVDFYIINHDGITIPRIREVIERRPDIDLFIVDEAGMFRNHSTKKFRTLEKLTRRHDVRLWLLTGTPCPNAPTDAWALAKLVSPDRVPKYFGAFKRSTMMEVSKFKWVPRADSLETAFNAMQPAVRFKKEDCLDLPPVTTQDHTCALTPDQTKAFKALQATMVAEAKEREITAVNAADQIGKLRQILCGAIRDTATGDYIVLPHQPRVAALLELIESASAKVLVVCPFKGILPSLEAEISKKFSVAVVNGDVSPKQRDKIILEFKTQADPHVLLCHPKVMSHGLNLTEADLLIFYAPIYSNDEYQQVTERFNRAGQTRKMTIVRLGAHPLEWKIYSMIDERKTTQNNILDLYKEITE